MPGAKRGRGTRPQSKGSQACADAPALGEQRAHEARSGTFRVGADVAIPLRAPNWR
jgi:hypothetical protein